MTVMSFDWNWWQLYEEKVSVRNQGFSEKVSLSNIWNSAKSIKRVQIWLILLLSVLEIIMSSVLDTIMSYNLITYIIIIEHDFFYFYIPEFKFSLV